MHVDSMSEIVHNCIRIYNVLRGMGGYICMLIKSIDLKHGALHSSGCEVDYLLRRNICKGQPHCGL